jgi:hypothetical protein
MSLVKPAWPILQRGDPLSLGLVGAWPFYEGSGLTVSDLSGKRNNGTFTNGPTWVGGLHGSAVKLTAASSQYIDCGNNPSLQITGAITISVWINYTTLISSQIVAKDNDTGGRAYAFDYDLIGGNLRFYVNGGSSLVQFGITPTVGQWYHLTASFIPSGAMALYVNGLVVATATAGDASIPSATTNCRIGARAYTGFQGYNNAAFGSVQIWNRALSAGEVAQLYFDSFSIYRPKRRVPWFTQASTGAQNLAPSLLTNTNTFFSPTVVRGTVNLAPSLFTNPDTFFNPTVGRGAAALAPSLFTNAGIFYSPTVTIAGPQALTPSLFTNIPAFYLPIVRQHISLLNVWVRLTEPHEFEARVWPKNTVFGPDQSTVPADFNYTPLMQGYSSESIAAVAQAKIDVWGRYDSHGNLLDNPPISRPIWDPQPTPPVGNKHLLPLGNTC